MRHGYRGQLALLFGVLLILAGCAGASPTASSAPSVGSPVPSQESSVAGAGTAELDQLAATLRSKGFDCTPQISTAMDPGAVAQENCGLSPLIEFLAFPSHDAVTNEFEPFLRENYCASSLRDPLTFLDGGTWAIYTTKDADTVRIGAALGIQPTTFC